MIVYLNRDSWYNDSVNKIKEREWFVMSYSMDDYIDYYYETAMEAERDYDDFIEEALELHKELKEMDNIIWKTTENCYCGVAIY